MTASWRNHQTGEALHNCPEEPPGKGDDFPEASSHEQVAANQTLQHSLTSKLSAKPMIRCGPVRVDEDQGENQGQALDQDCWTYEKASAFI